MSISRASDTSIRLEVLDALREMRRMNPAAKVLDIGGAANPWCDEFVDTYVDMNRPVTKKRVIVGDICQPEVWEEIAKVKYDFSICTHVLEDLRDPAFVIRQLLSISRSGFIAVPNKHTEMSCIESTHYLGYYHHRWIFTLLANGTVRIFPKLALVDYFLPRNRFHHFIGSHPLLRGIIERRLGPAAIPGGPGLKWVSREKVSMRYELGFLWDGSLSWEMARGDYAGPDYWSMIEAYRTELAEGI